MPIQRLSDDVVQLIHQLGAQQKEAGEIAQILNLKRVQVSTVLAHRKLQLAKVSELAREEGPGEVTEGAGDAPKMDQPVPETDNEDEEPEEESEGEDVEKDEGMYVGDDADHDPMYWEPMNPQAVQNPHLMIMGESGSGKTYAAQCLVAELAQRDIPAVLFDYGQSFEVQHLEKPFKDFTGIKEYLIGEEGLPLNPLQIFPKDVHGPKSVATRISDVFDQAYHLGDIQRKVMIDAIRRAFEKAGIDENSSSTWQKDPPTLLALQNVLEELSADKDYANYKNATGVSARLMTFFLLSSFRSGGETWSWDALLKDPKNKVHILQFRGLEGKTQRVLVELLLWHLFFYLKSHGQSRLRLYTVLDEAHHLSFREGGPVDFLLREARKFGLGLVFASQQPEDFSPAAYSNSASKLVFQTTDPTLRVSKFLAAKCSNYSVPEDISQVISVLRQGEAFFITKNRGHVIKLADFRKRATLWRQKQ